MPKPEPRPLRTLPERAFRARARLVAALLCCVCFAGLAARLAYLQLFTGSWYTSRALGQQLRDTVVPADRGRIYSADGALLAANSSCWTLRASPREMPEEKLSLAAASISFCHLFQIICSFSSYRGSRQGLVQARTLARCSRKSFFQNILFQKQFLHYRFIYYTFLTFLNLLEILPSICKDGMKIEPHFFHLIKNRSVS